MYFSPPSRNSLKSRRSLLLSHILYFNHRRFVSPPLTDILSPYVVPRLHLITLYFNLHLIIKHLPLPRALTAVLCVVDHLIANH